MRPTGFPALLTTIGLLLAIAPAAAQGLLRPPDCDRPREVIVAEMMELSLQLHPSDCPCPDSRSRSGRPCGGRAAWSPAGGERSPLCLPTDVTDAVFTEYCATGRVPH